MIISQEFQGKTDKTEKWYGTEYSLERIPASQIRVGLVVLTVTTARVFLSDFKNLFCLFL